MKWFYCFYFYLTHKPKFPILFSRENNVLSFHSFSLDASAIMPFFHRGLWCDLHPVDTSI